MAEYLASIFGTEKDKVNCSFYFKIGACRHGDRCSRIHNKPTFSQTILLSNLYQNPSNAVQNPDGTQGAIPNISEAQVQEHFDNFFEDIFVELEDKYGEIEEMNVCDNLGDHLVGNVYIKFKNEEDAERAVNDLNNRWFAGRPVYAELSPVTDFREACCRQYEMGECTRSGFCNFMHLKPISRDLRRHLYGRSRGRSRSRSRERDRDRERRRRSRSRDRDRSRRSRDRSRERRHRSRSRSRERRRDRSRSRDRKKDREHRSRDKSRERDRDHKRSSRDRDRDRKDRDRNRERKKDKEKSKTRSRSRSPLRGEDDERDVKPELRREDDDISRSPQSHENGQQQLQQYHEEGGDNDSQDHQGGVGEGAPSQSSTLTYDPLLLGMDVVIKDESSTDINGGV